MIAIIVLSLNRIHGTLSCLPRAKYSRISVTIQSGARQAVARAVEPASRVGAARPCAVLAPGRSGRVTCLSSSRVGDLRTHRTCPACSAATACSCGGRRRHTDGGVSLTPEPISRANSIAVGGRRLSKSLKRTLAGKWLSELTVAWSSALAKRSTEQVRRCRAFPLPIWSVMGSSPVRAGRPNEQVGILGIGQPHRATGGSGPVRPVPGRSHPISSPRSRDVTADRRLSSFSLRCGGDLAAWPFCYAVITCSAGHVS